MHWKRYNSDITPGINRNLILPYHTIWRTARLSRDDTMWDPSSVHISTAHGDRLEALRIILHQVTLPHNTALAYCQIEPLKLQRYDFQKKKSLNRSAMLRTASMTCSHVNVIHVLSFNCVLRTLLIYITAFSNIGKFHPYWWHSCIVRLQGYVTTQLKCR